MKQTNYLIFVFAFLLALSFSSAVEFGYTISTSPSDNLINATEDLEVSVCVSDGSVFVTLNNALNDSIGFGDDGVCYGWYITNDYFEEGSNSMSIQFLSGSDLDLIESLAIIKDSAVPYITISYNKDSTNQSVTVTATTSDDASLNNATVTFTENGNFTFIATDAAGNTNSSTVVISNIAVEVPSLPGVDFNLPEGQSADNATNVTVFATQTINIPLGNETSSITLPAGTVITMTDGTNLNLSELTSGNVSLANLSGLVGLDFKGALEFGIPELGLNFSSPITIKMYVGNELNGLTLNVYRSHSLTSNWTQVGLINKTCLVSAGICEFQTLQASYFVSTLPTVAVTGAVTTSHGGGGSYNPTWNVTKNPVNQTEAPIIAPTNNTQNTTITSNVTRAPFASGITGAVIGTTAGRWSLGIISFLILIGLAWWIVAAKKRRAVNTPVKIVKMSALKKKK